MEPTCKQLINGLHDSLWDVFWLSIAVHLGLVIIRFSLNYMRTYLKQNLQDHAELGQMINKGL